MALPEDPMNFPKAQATFPWNTQQILAFFTKNLSHVIEFTGKENLQ
jgi:hypothetical protein